MQRKQLIQEYLNDAWDLRRLGQYHNSKEVLVKAHKLCKEKDFELLGRVYHIYMQYEYDHEKYNEAVKFCRLAISFYVKGNNPNKIAHATRHLADLQLELNRLDKAEKNYLHAIDIYRKDPNTPKGDLANALRGYALVLEKGEKIAKAIEMWEEILHLYQDKGFQEGIDEASQRLKILSNKC